jgi:hypothetical protein
MMQTHIRYQFCMNIMMPTAAPILTKPARDDSENTTLRPPASKMPLARMAPLFANKLWYLSPIIYLMRRSPSPSVAGLLQDQGQADEGALTHEVDLVLDHRHQQLDGFLVHGA